VATEKVTPTISRTAATLVSENSGRMPLMLSQS